MSTLKKVAQSLLLGSTSRSSWASSATREKLSVRRLSIHENQAYSLLRSVGIPTPNFGVAKTPDEAGKIAEKLRTNDLVVKAQVLTGGRGKGRFKDSNVNGVVMCESPARVKDFASKMIGKVLVTKQTGPAGKICNSVMVTSRTFVRKEIYLSIMLERTYGGPVIIGSKEGGVNIEELAATDPKAIIYTPIDIDKGISCEKARDIACKLKVDDPIGVAQMIVALYHLFEKYDATLLEINPLALDVCGNYLALDCKFNFDEDAKFRQEELFALHDWNQQSDSENRAKKIGMNFVALDGNIGCIVNGAGLAMATMDIIKLKGGNPANFLDVGGTAEVESIAEAYDIISGDPKVEAVLVNIFGGIVGCDVIAKGIVAAFERKKRHIPVILRLQGKNVKEGRSIAITDANSDIILVDDLDQAAHLSVTVAEICRLTKQLNLEVKLTSKHLIKNS